MSKQLKLVFTDHEAQEICEDLPIEAPFYPKNEGQSLWEQVNKTPPNALVMIGKEGNRLTIWPAGGGFLCCDLKDLKGDLGPFAG